MTPSLVYVAPLCAPTLAGARPEKDLWQKKAVANLRPVRDLRNECWDGGRLLGGCGRDRGQQTAATTPP
jgi:hypothetical protein